MEQKSEINDKLSNFYYLHKYKIYSLLIVILISIILFFTIQNINKKKNFLISEKYIQAGLYLSSNNSIEAKNLLEEVIMSKNKFYSIVALNTIIEKELVSDKKTILKYFKVLENSITSKNSNDLILLKKALYLIKNSDSESGEEILKKLIKNNSTIKPIAEEILNK